MTRAETLAQFVTNLRSSDLPDKARERIKHNILDTIGCAIGALDGQPIKAIPEQVKEFGSTGQ